MSATEKGNQITAQGHRTGGYETSLASFGGTHFCCTMVFPHTLDKTYFIRHAKLLHNWLLILSTSVQVASMILIYYCLPKQCFPVPRIRVAQRR